MNVAESRVHVRATVNGHERSATVDARSTLAELLRDDFGLTGTHVGCDHGVCGSCTVSIDGASARACLTLAAQVDGHDVMTVEGLVTLTDDGLVADDAMGPLQRACLERHSFQCGFCTPGMLIVAAELLAERPNPTEAEVREAIAGNLCRCTGYDSIVAGILRAAELAAES